MSSLSYRSSRPDNWTHPRQPLDASLRRHAHGRVLPMEEPGPGITATIARIFRLR